MEVQTASPKPLSLQALELLNESPDHVYALTFNTRTVGNGSQGKWMVLRLDRVRGIAAILDEGETQPATYRVMAFSAGNTPEEAARDALRLKLAPERTVASDY